ncbi:exported hypothetical protein [Candidatus Competibacter denitrificans Run_A_D11]|uniref:Uncharacterized protein n=1 Tax=Candidatus Competibacter denitrificans Run_A_D11 TaxID=1400863 RepID=W6ME50_9GAMM|nr:exported hypothetical protein [Candidatus Competibacter denitrificans Run_A_D11]
MPAILVVAVVAVVAVVVVGVAALGTIWVGVEVEGIVIGLVGVGTDNGATGVFGTCTPAPAAAAPTSAACAIPKPPRAVTSAATKKL